MSVEEWNKSIDPKRMKFLLQEYSLSPDAIEESRRSKSRAWHALQWGKPIDSIMSETDILHRAIEQAQSWTIWNVKKVLLMRPPRIHVSDTDLNKIQNNSRRLFIHPNHREYFDIPYALQALKEVISSDAWTHVVMKKWIPFLEKGLTEGGWIMLLRGVDLKNQRNKNKDRESKWLVPIDLGQEFPELLSLQELPEFSGAFTSNEDRNMMVFGQWTRQTKKKGLDPFVFETERVIPGMQRNIDTTGHCTHVMMAIDYRWGQYVDITLKVLSEDEMRNWELWDTVNGFMDWVKTSK
jgi:hypothetical protein